MRWCMAATMAASVGSLLGLTSQDSGAATSAVEQASCTAPPEIVGFSLSRQNVVGLPWVQRFIVDTKVYGGAAFVSVYDDSGASAIRIKENGQDWRSWANRGTSWWTPGIRTEYVLVKTDCGTARASLSFDFQRIDIEKPSEYGVYVSAGDSYSSGEGNPPFINEGPCHVSVFAWPSLIFAYGLALTPYPETNLACSGARIDDLFRTFKGQPSQLERLKELKPVVATVTIGGNDVGFGKVLFQCFAWNCLSDSQFRAAQRDISNLKSRLKSAFTHIRAAVPRLIVVGYPRIFPATQPEAINCGWLTPRERSRLNVLAERVDQVERQAASAAKAEYVSLLGVLRGHELCSRDSWMFKVTPLCKFDSRCGHPLAEGQQAISDAVERHIG